MSDKKEEFDRIGLHLRIQKYSIPNDPKKLKHKRMNILEWLASLIVQSHVCKICGRKEIWSVKTWYFVNKEEVVCDCCYELNPKVFK